MSRIYSWTQQPALNEISRMPGQALTFRPVLLLLTYGLVLSLPFETFSERIAGIAASPTNAILILSVIVLIAHYVGCGRIAAFHGLAKYPVCALLMLLLFEMSSILLNSSQYEVGIGNAKTYIAYIIIFLLVMEVIDSEERVHRVFQLLTVSMSGVAIITYLASFGIFDLNIKIGNRMAFMTSVTDYDRMMLVPMSRGLFGMIIVCVVMYHLIKWFARGERRYIHLAVILFLAPMILLAMSRNTFLGIFVALLVCMMMYSFSTKSWANKFAIIALAVGGIVIAYFLMDYMILTSYDSIAQRLSQYSLGWQLFSDSPMLGIGTVGLNEISWHSTGNPIHNFFINMVVSKGLIGSSPLWFMMLFTAIGAYRLFKLRTSFSFRYWWLFFAPVFIAHYAMLNAYPGTSIKIHIVIMATMFALLKYAQPNLFPMSKSPLLMKLYKNVS